MELDEAVLLHVEDDDLGDETDEWNEGDQVSDSGHHLSAQIAERRHSPPARLRDEWGLLLAIGLLPIRLIGVHRHGCVYLSAPRRLRDRVRLQLGDGFPRGHLRARAPIAESRRATHVSR